MESVGLLATEQHSGGHHVGMLVRETVRKPE